MCICLLQSLPELAVDIPFGAPTPPDEQNGRKKEKHYSEDERSDDGNSAEVHVDSTSRKRSRNSHCLAAKPYSEPDVCSTR